ncbi:MAG TPA: MMPL family transporter [Thermoguttaceae bacterium]|nr:MMPL family transporter [Thermoguttaceae bacterium]
MKPSFFARRSFTVLMVVTFMLPLIWMGTRRAVLSNKNDVKKWLPEGFDETKDHQWFEEHFPHEQFVLISWEGCTLEDKDSKLRLLTKKLTPPQDAKRSSEEPQYFKEVVSGLTLVEKLEIRGYPREEILERFEESLIGKEREDGDRNTCLVVTLNDTYHGRELRDVLEKIRATAEECAVSRDEIRLGGPPVDNAAIDYEGERTLIRLAFLSLAVGLGVSWLCFRSIRLTNIVFVCALLSAGTGMAIVFFSGGIVDAILMSMPSLVYVLAISGAIHIVNYYHDAVREGGLAGAADRALQHGWRPCTVAAITTAIGLGSLLKSDLIPIRNFGLYAALGVLASLGFVFLLLPALLQYFRVMGKINRALVARFVRIPALVRYADARIEATAGNGGRRNGEEDTVFLRFWLAIGSFITRRNGWVAAGCVALMVFFAVGATRIQTSVKLMKLFSDDAEIIGHYAWLEEHLGPLVPMEVVIRIDNDKCRLTQVERMRLARRVELAVESLKPQVGGALSPATFMPDIESPQSQGGLFGRLVKGTRDRVTNDILQEHPFLLDEMRQYLVFDETTNEELWRVSARVEALGDVNYAHFVEDLKHKVDPVIEAYQRAGWEGLSVTYTGLVPLIYKAQTELLKGLFQSLQLAFVLIALVMMFVLRSPLNWSEARGIGGKIRAVVVMVVGSFMAGLLAMVPNLFPVVVIFGVMGWLGILVDVGSMMTASVALGVAVDDTIHYLTWFRQGMAEGRSRKGAVTWAYQRCATAMSQTTLIGGMGLAVFAFSSFTPTQRFGYLMLALLGAALIGDLIFLPALLSGPIGRFFRSAKKEEHPDESPEVFQEDLDREPPPDEPSEDDSDGRCIAVPIQHPPHRKPTRSSSRAS